MIKTPIRLLQITHDLEIGGLQQVVVNLCRKIDRNRFYVQVLCLRSLGPLTDEIERLGIKVHLLPQKVHGTDYFSFLKVANFLTQEKIQIIHTHNTQPLVDGTIGALLSSGRTRIFHTDHARTFPDKKRYMFAEWCCSHFLRKFIGVSEQTTSNLRKYEKIPIKKLITIENGIDSERFDVDVDTEVLRTEFKLSITGPVIGVISRLEKVKGITYLLKAMPELLAKHPDLSLLVVGDGGERNALERECEELDIRERVVFTGNRFDIPEILKLLDVYLLPSLSEGLPMGLLEAMASGCPVVASRVGGVPGAVKHGETALLVSPGQSDEIAMAVDKLLNDPRLRETIANNIKVSFGKKYSAANMANRYMDLYDSEKYS
jgi:glycosyltransferase involved in cell wall biosynthesis